MLSIGAGAVLLEFVKPAQATPSGDRYQRMERAKLRSIATGSLAVAVTALTLVLGIMFAQTQQTERVAEAAEQQSQASNAFRLIESMNSRAEGALITVAAFNAGLTGEAERDSALASITEAQVAIAATSIPLFDNSLAPAIAEFITLLEAGDTDIARTHLDEVIDPLALTIRTRANITSQEAVNTIAVETGIAVNWGLITSFGVGLLAPLLALGVFRSFANRRRKQDSLEQQLQRVEELGQAKDDMIGNLSHELRTPLTGIYGFALALDDMGFEDAEFAAEMNSFIIRDAADLNRMVDDLLVAAKAENEGLNFSPADISVEREVTEVLVPLKTSEKNIVTDIEDTNVFADRLRVRQIVRNLVSNAEKHGGQNITIKGHTVGSRYVLDVTDDGSGVSPELVDRLFDRFVHDGDAPLTQGSVGVGLSVAQALATGMGSRIDHEQSPGQCTFSLVLPLAAPSVDSDPGLDIAAGPTPAIETPAPSPSPSPVQRPAKPAKKGKRTPKKDRSAKRGETSEPVALPPALLPPPEAVPAMAGVAVSADLPADPFS